MMRRSLGVVALLAACHSSQPSAPETPVIPALQQILEAKPANGYQVVLPKVTNLQPGTETELCTWTHLIVDHDVSVRAVQAYQTLTGHHVIMYTTSKQQPAGLTRVCTDDDMASFRFGAGSGAEGAGGKNVAPGDLVFPVPAGSQIVLNHHYINATPEVHDAQSAMNIWLADPGHTYINSASIAVLDTSLRLAPGPGTMDIDCTVPRELKAWLAIPHMHQYGSRMSIERISGATVDALFNVDPWSPSYMFHPPELVKDPAAPLVLAAGDHVHVRCEWDNTLSTTLTFGLEMCVAFMQIVDDQNLGNLQCDGGKWGAF